MVWCNRLTKFLTELCNQIRLLQLKLIPTLFQYQLIYLACVSFHLDVSAQLFYLPSVTRKHSMQEDSSRSPTYTVSCEDYVHVVEFSPFSSGSPASLLAYGGNQYVVVGTCLFQVRDVTSHYLAFLNYFPSYSGLNTYFSPQEEDMEVEGVEFNVLRVFHHELRVDALAWSPESRLDRIPIIRY